MSGSINTSFNGSYSTLPEQFKLKRAQSITNKASYNLYATLIMKKENNASGSMRIWDILSFSNRETLTENDKEKIFHTLDNLRQRWMTNEVIKNLTKEDFAKIKERQTSKGRAETMLQIIIDKSWNKDNKSDILEHVNAAMSSNNAEMHKKYAENMALKILSLNRFRHYWWVIRKLIEKSTSTNNEVDRSSCYIDVIKYANYASMNILKRTWTRYIVPVKFSWRNIPKQTQKTLDALKERSANSKNVSEVYAIDYIIDKLQKAFDFYKETIWPSNSEFESARLENTNNIYKFSPNEH